MQRFDPTEFGKAIVEATKRYVAREVGPLHVAVTAARAEIDALPDDAAHEDLRTRLKLLEDAANPQPMEAFARALAARFLAQ